MKKLYTLASLVGFTAIIFGQTQLPNSGLENWETIPYETTSYESPTSWNPGEICASIENQVACSVSATKSTDASTGDFAAKVGYDGFFGLTLIDYDFTDRPSSLELKLKKSLLPNDKADVSVYLHNGSIWDEVDEDIFGEGTVDVIGNSTSYETLKVDINYSAETAFEHITVVISVTEDTETNQSFIYVDDLKLKYDKVGLQEKTAAKKITVSPNPATNVLSFNEELTQFDILAVSGETVQSGVNTETVDVSTLNQGIYLIKGLNAVGELVTSRFVKQ